MSNKTSTTSKPKIIDLPTFSPDFRFTNLDEACALTPLRTPSLSSTPTLIGPLTLSSNPQAFFSIILPRDWCIGFVPHGGFLTSLLTQAGLEFLTQMPTSPWGTSLPSPFKKIIANHIHPMKFQLEFLRRATADTTAIIRIEARKLGAAYSVLAASLYQVSENTTNPVIHQECCTGFITFTNLPISEPSSALTIPLPKEYVIPPLSSCVEVFMPEGSNTWRICADKLSYRVPPSQTELPTTTATRGLIQQWIRWSDYPQRKRGFVPRDIGFLCDMFFPPAEPLLVEAGLGRGLRWYPTLGYEIELRKLPSKKALSDSGEGKGEKECEWEWLFMQVRMKALVRGRIYLTVEVWDEEGELVARASQVALVVSGEKNAKGRGESKL